MPAPQGLQGLQGPVRKGVVIGAERPEVRERIVERARELFLRQGFEATGVAEIARAAGVNAGSLYYFFGTKESLLVAVLERYQVLLEEIIAAPAFASTEDPVARVFAVLEGYRGLLQGSGCRYGCPIGNLALEMSERSEEVRAAVAANFRSWRRMIETCLKAASDRFPAGTDFEAMSAFILSVMEGAVMQARTFRSLAPFDASMSLLRKYLEAEQGKGPDRGP